MWPWGHAAVGYLLLTLWWRSEYEIPPPGRAVLAVGFGTQLPDVVDKPLSWTWGVLPNGRSLGHSAITAAVVCTALWVVYRDTKHGRTVGALALGYWSHLAADALDPILSGEFGSLAYVGYPLVEPITYETGKSFLEHFRTLAVTPLFGFELLLVALALAAWRQDGYPGLRLLGRRVGLIDPEPGPVEPSKQN